MKILMTIVMLLAGAAVQADEAAPVVQAPGDAPKVYRLAPEDVLRAQADGAARRDVFDPSQWPVIADRRIHGEMSAFVGTGGARGVSGVAVVPLGDSGTATFAFENSRFNGRGARRRY